MSGRRETVFTHRCSSLPLSFILFFPSGIGCGSSGSARLWKRWWWEVFPRQVCLLKRALGGALPGPVSRACSFPKCSDPHGFSVSMGSVTVIGTGDLGEPGWKGHWIISPYLINWDLGWGVVFTCKIYKDTWVSQEDPSSVLRIHVKKSRAWWHTTCSCNLSWKSRDWRKESVALTDQPA